MKSLILILLMGVGVQAQTIADLARQERAKQQAKPRTQPLRVITNDDLKRLSAAAVEVQAAAQAGGQEQPATGAEAAKAEPAKPTQAGAEKAAMPATTQPDPVQAWNAEMASLRAQIRELQDKETATQLQINDLTNKVYAPVTSVKARNEAQAGLSAAQKNLTTIREQIVATRLKLEQLQARGPARN
jgi:hypothetical protein